MGPLDISVPLLVQVVLVTICRSIVLLRLSLTYIMLDFVLIGKVACVILLSGYQYTKTSSRPSCQTNSPLDIDLCQEIKVVC